jgi:hypothetical protein
MGVKILGETCEAVLGIDGQSGVRIDDSATL